MLLHEGLTRVHSQKNTGESLTLTGSDIQKSSTTSKFIRHYKLRCDFLAAFKPRLALNRFVKNN